MMMMMMCVCVCVLGQRYAQTTINIETTEPTAQQ